MSRIDYNTSEYIVIYVYSFPDVTTHVGHVKVGKANIKLSDYALADNKEKAVELAARKRIGNDLKTSEVNFTLEYSTLAIKDSGESFMDHDVHSVLKRSGIPNIVHTENKKYGEWFVASRDTAIRAINAVKNGQSALDASDIVNDTPMTFRKGSQTDAIEKTIKAIQKGKKHFLWDAKMRFGKTLTSLEVARRMNYGKILIITHRPEVSDDWYKDFKKLFAGTDYKFGSRDKGENIARLQSGYLRGANGAQANPFVYFASVQYLRHEVKSAEKLAILAENWDMLIIDEADEGIKTALADETISPIPRNFTLMLSGTPFNLLEDYKEDEIYSWDYTAEQELKARWDELYPDEPNPYYKLPKLSIFTYNLNKYLPNTEFKDLYDKAFNFKEFFRTDETGNFIHEKYVKKFVDLISTESTSNFPYSTDEFRKNLRHTLWMLPGVKEARALEKLLNSHPVFMHFNIANVAGDGNEEVAEAKSRKLVQKAITDDPLHNYSITLSCGKMTRGVSVPEWSAVFMLSNTTSASTYLQTIFRCQTPWEIDGQLKTECFVFDFAPDRTLNVVAEVMKIKKKKPTTDEVKEATGKFLNFCPVISATDGEMKPFSSQKLLHAIKKVAIQKVTRNGFDDPRLYNLENLSQCSDEDLADFDTLNNIIGKSTGVKNDGKVKLADNGFTEEQREKAKQAEKKKKEKQPLTPEEEELLRRKREITEQRKTRISILRGISIRMPMLIYGCKTYTDSSGIEQEIEPDSEISLEHFIEYVDDESWEEFMPSGVSKQMLREKFAKYYDDEVFIGAGIDIRLRALAADHLAPSERVAEIGEIFKGFKNPDKETVLTPWRVVNMHISSTLGGSDFNDIIEFDSEKDQKGEKIGLPNWKDQGDITRIWSDKNAKVLEINSKSGLYPLLCAYNFYDKALSETIKDYHATEEDVFRKLWDEILERNIFVLTKSPMAKTITERTLAGYTGAKTNVVYIPDLITKLKQPNFNLLAELKQQFSLKGDDDMKFTAVVGNPPYQETVGKSDTQTQGNSNWIYQYFQDQADKLGDLTSLIYPFGGWFDAPERLGGLGKRILSDQHTVAVRAYEGTTDKRAWYRTDKQPVPIFGNSANLSAGVSIVLRDTKNIHDTYQYSNRIYSDSDVTVNASDWEMLAPNPEFLNVANKLTGDKLISGVKKGIFGIESNFVELNPTKVSKNKSDWQNPIQLLANDKSGSSGRTQTYWTDSKYIPKGYEYLKQYKVIMTSAYPKQKLTLGMPTIENVKKRAEELMKILPSQSAFGASRLVLFMSDSKEDCDNFIKYSQTSFFAALTLQEPNRRATFGDIIPLQNFTATSDIDWSQSIPEIDQQLYRKYNLSSDEIAFVESRVKAME